MVKYFYIKSGQKIGPVNKEKLISEVDENTLVWHEGLDDWKKASDFEELKGSYVIKPPPTPKERKMSQANNKFTKKIVGWLALIYFLTALSLGFLSFVIAQASWNKYLEVTDGKYLEPNTSVEKGRPPLISQEELEAILKDPNTDFNDELKAYSDASDFRQKDDGFITYKELNDNRRYPIYTRGINNESYYGSGQSFLFRPFKAFGSTIYLTSKEQQNNGDLLGNLMLSSFASLIFIFVGIGIIWYLKLIL